MDLLQNIMRPKKLNEVVGQNHLIGKNKILSNLVKNNKLFNIIFFGTSGIGKTTIALALMNDLNVRYRLLNATINSKKDFEVVFEEAKMYGNIVLIIDEIHRMNKDKQDLLLSYIESGIVTLIGLTSSNPYHSINPAIRSRCQMLELKKIDKNDIIKSIKKIKNEYKDLNLSVDTIKYIASLSNGDLRYAYNLVEFCYYSFGGSFTKENIKEVNTSPNINYDKNEDGHYDLLSAFHKSIRGSDVNASLFYLSKLIESGDMDSLHRRMLAIAYEDIGLSNPMMGTKVLSAIVASERLGMPEAILPLSNVVIDMSLSPKSNSAYLAYNASANDAKKSNGKVPKHLKNPSNDYLYPHNYPNYYVEQQYLPDDVKTSIYYHPKKNKYETELYKYNETIKKNAKK